MREGSDWSVIIGDMPVATGIPMSYMGTKRAFAEVATAAILEGSPDVVADPFSGMGSIASTIGPRARLILGDALYFPTAVSKVRFGATARLSRAEVEVALRSDFERHRNLLSKHYGSTGNGDLAGSIESTPRVTTSDSMRARASAAARVRVGESGRYEMACLYYRNSYLSARQCVEVDAIRYAIDQQPANVRLFLNVALVLGAARCFNAPGHSAQYFKGSSEAALRRVEAQWRRSVFLEMLDAVDRITPIGDGAWRRSNKVVQGDAISTLRSSSNIDVVYLDPPYTKDQYSRFYHVHEELFRYRYPQVQGDASYPVDRFHSLYCRKTQALAEYALLFEAAASSASRIVLSLPETTFLGDTRDVVVPCMEPHWLVDDIHVVNHIHSSMGGSKGVAVAPVNELLIVARNSYD